MTKVEKYVPTAREQAFLATVENPRYDRQIINGLSPFFKDRVPDDVRGFYSDREIEALRALKGTERDVEARMPVKMTRHYFELESPAAKDPDLEPRMRIECLSRNTTPVRSRACSTSTRWG